MASAARSSRSTTRAPVPVVVTMTMRTTTMRRMTSSKPTWRGVCHTLPGCAIYIACAVSTVSEGDGSLHVAARVGKAGSMRHGESYRAGRPLNEVWVLEVKLGAPLSDAAKWLDYSPGGNGAE